MLFLSSFGTKIQELLLIFGSCFQNGTNCFFTAFFAGKCVFQMAGDSWSVYRLFLLRGRILWKKWLKEDSYGAKTQLDFAIISLLDNKCATCTGKVCCVISFRNPGSKRSISCGSESRMLAYLLCQHSSESLSSRIV